MRITIRFSVIITAIFIATSLVFADELPISQGYGDFAWKSSPEEVQTRLKDAKFEVNMANASGKIVQFAPDKSIARREFTFLSNKLVVVKNFYNAPQKAPLLEAISYMKAISNKLLDKYGKSKRAEQTKNPMGAMFEWIVDDVSIELNIVIKIHPENSTASVDATLKYSIFEGDKGIENGDELSKEITL